MTGFSFASLLFSIVAPALAAEPIAEVVANNTQAAAVPDAAQATLTARWETEINGKELLVKLTLLNTGSEATDIVISRGKQPGPWLQAAISGSTLDRNLTKSEMQGEMSRMGPMPTFAPVAAGTEIFAGTYRFALPAGYAGEPISLEASVSSHDGETRVQTVVGGNKAGV